MKILIIKLSSVGDVVHALPVAAALKKLYPGCCITWAVEPAAGSLLSYHRYVDDVLVFDKAQKKKPAYIISFVRELRRRKYDLCIDLQGLFKSAVIAFFARSSKKIGWYNLREGSWLISRRTSGAYRRAHVVERYLDVPRVLGYDIAAGTADFGIDFSEQEIFGAKKLCSENMLDVGLEKYAVIAPGSVWKTKCWPVRYFANLAREVAAQGLTPVIVGAPSEQQLVAELVDDYRQEAAAKIVNLAGKTSLKQLAYIVSKACLFIGNDSGPLHIAAAFAVPSLVFFGPSRFGRTGPYGSRHTILQTNCENRECMKRVCPLGKECMADITVRQAITAVADLLGAGG